MKFSGEYVLVDVLKLKIKTVINIHILLENCKNYRKNFFNKHICDN